MGTLEVGGRFVLLIQKHSDVADRISPSLSIYESKIKLDVKICLSYLSVFR